MENSEIKGKGISLFPHYRCISVATIATIKRPISLAMCFVAWMARSASGDSIIFTCVCIAEGVSTVSAFNSSELDIPH